MHGQGGRPGGIVVLALTRGGSALGERLAAELGAEFRPCRGRVAGEIRLAWQSCRALVCIMAAGIVVRTIAPLLADKHRDPAVVVCDEGGRFAIPLVSGHLGGANDLARRIAGITGGVAALTTASDVLGRTALDLWCRDLGLRVAEPSALTAAMGRLVDRGEVSVWSCCPLPDLPPDLHPVTERERAELVIDVRTDGSPEAALLHPPALVLGIGCNRGTPAGAIDRAVSDTLGRHGLAPAAVCGLASIDLKRDEAGLLAYAVEQGLATRFYDSQALNSVPGVSSSAAVLRATGARGVAEPAALLAAGPGAILRIAKEKYPDVTVAVAERADPLGVHSIDCISATTTTADTPAESDPRKTS
jgi:cobalt-precorrin 5A hydrolase